MTLKNTLDPVPIAIYMDRVFDLLTNFTKSDKDLILKNTKCVTLEKNEYLFTEGESPSSLLCLVEGKMKVHKEGLAGRDWIARLVKPVELVGYRALFADSLYSGSAQALEYSIVCSIDKDVLFDILIHNHRQMFAFAKLLARELGDLNSRSITLTQKHIRGRLAETLLLLKNHYGYEEDTKVLNIYLRREDIASLSNMTPSNAIRTLSAFNAEGIISLEGRKIVFIDENALINVSENG